MEALYQQSLAAGAIDFVADFAEPLATYVIGELLGVPPEDHAWFHTHAKQVVQGLDPEVALEKTDSSIVRSRIRFVRYFHQLAGQRRADPRDDVLTDLVVDDGRHCDADARISDAAGPDEVISSAVLLLTAGIAPIVDLLSCGLHELIRQSRSFERLAADPRIAPSVVEELLRLQPSVQCPVRKASTDVTIEGTDIARGSTVVAVLGAANRDPAVYADPDQINPDRRRAGGHLAFGMGPHFCLGAAVSRLLARAAFIALAHREPKHLVEDLDPVYRMNLMVRGLERLPVQWVAGKSQDSGLRMT
ncbi:hypothetical protein M878_25280 [Streptomyces roseochromogenus subsp. oscitans DS 12.976]|uniref:Cytochrome P450 n=1 Tax=Streptomyces roseochromogenus subsp. oscitans DS 12.976 TaxID=1352936 RepID=V6KEA4_STRRC|nr:hypothetical protein M878_25280 [Streptomyces roseochromogenus subsp. oscitans DS 12.976]